MTDKPRIRVPANSQFVAATPDECAPAAETPAHSPPAVGAILPDPGITHERLLEILAYNSLTGKFTWKISPVNSVAVGRTAGSLNVRGYILIRAFGVCYSAHRLAWFYHYGIWPSKFIDHIDGNPLNNAIANLREATHAENAHNIPARGYSWDKSMQKFRSAINIRGHKRFLGYFFSAEDARAAYLAAHAEAAGEFSFTRRPSSEPIP